MQYHAFQSSGASSANYALRDLVNWIGLTSVARSHALSYRFSKIIPRFRSNMQIMSRAELFEYNVFFDLLAPTGALILMMVY